MGVDLIRGLDMRKQAYGQESRFGSTDGRASSIPRPDFSNTTPKVTSSPSSSQKSSPTKNKSDEEMSPSKTSKPIDVVKSLNKDYGKPSECRQALRKMLEKFNGILNLDSDKVVTSFTTSKKREGLKALRISQLKTLHQALQKGIIHVEDFSRHKVTLYDDENLRSAITSVLAEEAESELGASPEWGGEYNSLILGLKGLIKQKKFVFLKYKSATEIYKAQVDNLRSAIAEIKSEEITDSESDFQFDVDFSSSDDSSSRSPQKKLSTSVESQEARKMREENDYLNKRLDDTALILSLDLSSRSGSEIELQRKIEELQECYKEALQKNSRLTKTVSVKDQEIAELRAASELLSDKVKRLEAKQTASRSSQKFDETVESMEAKYKAELESQAQRFEQMLAERDRAAKEREAVLRAELEHAKLKKEAEVPKELSALKKSHAELRKKYDVAVERNRLLDQELKYMGSLTEASVKTELLKKTQELMAADEANEQLRAQIKSLKYGGSPSEYQMAAQPLPAASKTRKKLFGSDDEESELATQKTRRPLFIETLSNTSQLPPTDDLDGSLSV